MRERTPSWSLPVPSSCAAALRQLPGDHHPLPVRFTPLRIRPRRCLQFCSSQQFAPCHGLPCCCAEQKSRGPSGRALSFDGCAHDIGLQALEWEVTQPCWLETMHVWADMELRLDWPVSQTCIAHGLLCPNVVSEAFRLQIWFTQSCSCNT